RRPASGRPQAAASAKPKAAPSDIPSQDAAVEATMPNCAPATVLTTLEGMGSKMSLANKTTVPSATAAGEGGGLSQLSMRASSCGPKKTNGTIGTASAKQTIASDFRKTGIAGGWRSWNNRD